MVRFRFPFRRNTLSRPVLFVLVGTRTPGNIGAVCRAVGAFGLAGVRLVRPECDPAHDEARWLAHGAEDVLRSVTVHDDLADALRDCGRSSATTARPRNWRRPVLAPEDMRDEAAAATPERPFALVFGPEDRGLTNEDLSRCDSVVSIPLPDDATATLSLPAAAALLAREAARETDRERAAAEPDADGALDAAGIDALLDEIHHTLDGIGFRPRPDRVRFRGSLRDFLARARPTDADRRMMRHLFAQVGKWRRRIRGEADRGLLS
ncbi:RNA methyltransferase [bacterium]|nr:RNA methyltransferase [bacterium]